MIDSHFHIWRLDRGDYGWLTPALGVIHRDITVSDWQLQAGQVGVNRGVLVQAAPTEAETLFLLDAAGRHPDVISGVVGWAALDAADAVAAINKLAQNEKLVGLRPMLHDLPEADWVLRPELSPALAAMQRANLTFDALVRPAHLPHILALAQRHPDLRLIVDHGAKPDIRNHGYQPWARAIAKIARETAAFCKLSGLMTEAKTGATATDVRRYVEHLLSEFGAARLLWGSDWPVLELAADYATWQRMASELVPAADHAAVFTTTALAAYPRIIGGA